MVIIIIIILLSNLKYSSRTNQHSCNDVNADCTVLLQYTCSDTLRDGTSTEYDIYYFEIV